MTVTELTPLLTDDRDPNNQQRKLDFLNANQDDRAIHNPHGLQQPVSPYEVMAGAVISASLVTGLKSDLRDLIVAQVTEDVYDIISGKVLLIPRGARLIGSYDSVVAFGQSRGLLVWQRIVMPNGSSVLIDNLPATDTAGYDGLEDDPSRRLNTEKTRVPPAGGETSLAGRWMR